ncbi:lectin BRA-3-like [Patiria miniata]|uniref:C-type lectin domain-containing protein n=1 Tax=Patiria miniata TaxID=46514 RepID=A0A914BSF8_PATMI|nr:lectin BRA-3-like [Patiria miniata]
MRLAVTLLLVVGVGHVFVFASLCPPEWQRFGDSCYVMMTQRMSWHEADQSCREMDASLAVPNSAPEQKFMWELFLQTFDNNPEVSLWIGCNDIAEEGTWKQCPLKGGNHSLYENWKAGQPDNVAGGDCGVLGLRLNGQWDDQDCGLRRHVACEYHIPRSNGPATFCLTTEAEGSMSPKCLVGHILRKLPIWGVVSCGKACRSRPRCRSFNVLKNSRGDWECQLNSATRLEAGEENMEEINNCYFFDL